MLSDGRRTLSPPLRYAVAAAGLFLAWGLGVAALAAPSIADPKVDAEIEAALPEIEAARQANQLPQIHPRYLDRTDRAGKVLSAWTLSDDQAAFEALHALSSFDSPEPWADVGSAAIYLRWKTWDQVKGALARAKALDPKIPEIAVLEGDAARAQGDAAGAATAYHRALDLHPEDVFAFEGLGQLALAAGQSAEAETDFAKAVAADKDDPTAVRGLAEARIAKGDQAGALAVMDDSHRLLPEDATPWLETGKLRLKLGDAPGAARDFEQARRLGSTDPVLLKLLSETYRSQGRADDERKLLNDLISQQAADAQGYVRRAELREATDLPGALSDLHRAQEMDKSDPSITAKLAELTAKSGDLTESIGLYREVVGRKPELKPQLEALERQAQLAQKPLKGNVGQINTELGSELNRLYRQLLKKTPGLAGSLKVRVTVNAKGEAEEEEMLEDTVKSPELRANLRWNAHDAHYPPAANRYVLKFALKP